VRGGLSRDDTMVVWFVGICENDSGKVISGKWTLSARCLWFFFGVALRVVGVCGLVVNECVCVGSVGLWISYVCI